MSEAEGTCDGAAMSSIGATLSSPAGWLPIKWVRPLSGVSLVVPFYHVVSDAHVPHVSNLYRFRNVAEFTKDLEFFAKHFEPVSLSDIVDALDGKRALPRASVHITFDDGFREVYEIVAPILQRFGVPATFFVNTAFLDGGGLAHYNAISVLLDRKEIGEPLSPALRDSIESVLPPKTGVKQDLRQRIRSLNYRQAHTVTALAALMNVNIGEYVRVQQPHLTSEQVSWLGAKGFSVGSHSHSHILYSDLSLPEQLEQTRVSLDLLSKLVELFPRSFAFPHNDTGVTKEFFDAVFSEDSLDVTFGTSGLVTHFNPRNIQRVAMEKTPAPASQIVARQYARATYRRLRMA